MATIATRANEGPKTAASMARKARGRQLRATINEPFVVRVRRDGNVRLRLSVDERHDDGEAIRREHDLPQFRVRGGAVTDQHGMRRGVVMTVRQHLAALRRRYPGEESAAYVGNGNLLANYGFAAWLGGRLYHLGDEPVFRRPYTCLVAWRDGPVTVEDLWFARENGSFDVLRKLDGTVEDVTEKVEFVTSGQRIVRGGRAVPVEQFAENWYDLRHIVNELPVRFNSATLFFPNAQLQQGLARKALVGPVHTRLEAVVDERTMIPLTVGNWQRLAGDRPEALGPAHEFLTRHGILAEGASLRDEATRLHVAERIEEAFQEAVADAGYRLLDQGRPLAEGEARFLNGHIEIHFRRAVYPHSVFVTWPDGSWGFVLWPGKSGRSGTTIANAQRFLTELLGVQDAVLLDNGGDVRLWYRGQYVLPPSEKRPQIRSILAISRMPGVFLADAISIT